MVALVVIMVGSLVVTWWRRYRDSPRALAWAAGALVSGTVAFSLPTMAPGISPISIFTWQPVAIAVYLVGWYLAERSFRLASPEPATKD